MENNRESPVKLVEDAKTGLRYVLWSGLRLRRWGKWLRWSKTNKIKILGEVPTIRFEPLRVETSSHIYLFETGGGVMEYEKQHGK